VKYILISTAYSLNFQISVKGDNFYLKNQNFIHCENGCVKSQFYCLAYY